MNRSSFFSRIAALSFALLLCISMLAGCGKSEAVLAVEEQISAIGEVTSDSGDAIEAAENAYAALPDEEKSQVGNYDELGAARISYVERLINDIGEVTLDSESAIVSAEAAFDALSDEEKALISNAETLTAAREAYDALPVFENDYVVIEGIYVDDSSENPDYPGTRLVYLFYTVRTPDANYRVSSNGLDMTIQGTNTYESDQNIGSGAKYAPSYYYDSSLIDVYVGDGTKVVSTFRIPVGELEPGRTIVFDAGNYGNFEGIKLYTDDVVHMDSAQAIAQDIDPEGYAEEMYRREPADAETTQLARSLMNGYYWTFWTTYPVSMTYRIEFSSPNYFEVSTSLLGGSNGGTYEVTNGYIMCTYSSNDTTLEIPYEFKDGDISLDLGAVW